MLNSTHESMNDAYDGNGVYNATQNSIIPSFHHSILFSGVKL